MPRLPRNIRVLGGLPGAQQLRLTVALEPQDPAGLQALATAVSTPGSPVFRQYLTVDEFAQRFGATPAAISAVDSALSADGLKVGTPTANDLTIPVTGSAAQVEHAFSVSESQAQVSGRTVYLNDQAPVLPSTVAGYVQGVIGLDDVTQPQPQQLVRLHVRRPKSLLVRRSKSLRRAHAASSSPLAQAIGSGPGPCSEAASQAAAANQYGGSGLGYTADEVAAMYGMGSYYPSDEGQGQTVALVELGPTQTSDIGTYQACYGNSASVTDVNVDGGPGTYTPGQPGQDDDGEATLDIDQILGLAPKASILVYQAPEVSDPTALGDILTAIASQDTAKVISSSWGECETLTEASVIASENTSLQEMAAQGQSFFISSGDSGSSMCYKNQGNTSFPIPLSVIDPGGQPFATAVGGTTMGEVVGPQGSAVWDLPDNGTYPGEFVWNDGVPGGALPDPGSATGGGVSDQWTMPSYQSSAAGSLDVIQSASSRTCGTSQFCRQVPDVSADADPNSGYVVYSNGGNGGGWAVVGGTSAAAPLWAAFTALANASSTCRGLTLGFENPALYQIAGSAYAANFHDISQASPFTGDANNDIFGGQNSGNPSALYPVQAGYDMATGLGTPIANVLGNSLCAARAPVFTVAVTNPGSQSTMNGKTVSLAIQATDSGSSGLTYSATGLPAGLSINGATGVISGTVTTAQSTTVTVTATDAFVNTGSTTFSWTVTPVYAVVVTNPGSQSTGNGKAVSLAIKATDSGNAALTYSATGLPAGLSISSATGVISGTVTTVQSAATVTVTATDVDSNTGSTTFTWTVTPIFTVAVTNPGNQSTGNGEAVSLAIQATDSGNAGLSYSATGLPAGLSISSATGVISGMVTTVQSTTVTVTATDVDANTGSTTFTWTVLTPRPPTWPSVSFSGLGRSKPKLSFTVDAGAFAPALRSVTISLPRGLSFTGSARNLRKGIVVKSGGSASAFTASSHGSSVTISFSSALTSATITISSPAVTISSSEASKIHKHKVGKLNVSLSATDASGKTSVLATTVGNLS
ncbi:MAG: putative Ig domain-containing protein [Solirubrobacteraceae bacterium]